jgi:phospholipid/cholesterol/gamma-HCH transport system ATP-binding protein
VTDPLLRVDDVYKSYGDEQVLSGVSFEMEPGDVDVVIGPSGSGKTVLMKHIIGLEHPDQGEILLDGQPLKQSDVVDQYRLAIVFQSGALLSSLTVGENVGLYLTEHRLKPPEEIQRIVAEKLELVGLKGKENISPSELSGGMRKRVAIARALVIDPHLILYDEPTSELDPLSAVTIGEEILSLKERIQVTSLVVTHDRDLAFGVADRIAIIHEGKILSIGTPDEIRADTNPLVRKFLTVNFKPNHNKQSL